MAVSANKGESLKDALNQFQTLKPPKHNTVGTWYMICGMPNVGKSTIINQVR